MASGEQHDRFGVHHAASGELAVGEQPAQVGGLVGLHLLQEAGGLLGGQLGEQVGGVVGLHDLQDVRGALDAQGGQDLDPLLLGEFLEDVGQPFVVEVAGHLQAALVRQVLQHVGEVRGAQLVDRGQQAVDALLLLGALDRQPADVGPLERGRSQRGGGTRATHCATCTRVMRQSRCRSSSMAASTTVAGWSSGPIGHAAVEELADHEGLAGPLLEAAHVDAGVDHDLAAVDGGHARDGQEDPAAALHLHDQAEHPGRLDGHGAAPPRGRAPCPACRRPGRTRRSRTGATRRRALCCQPSQRRGYCRERARSGSDAPARAPHRGRWRGVAYCRARDRRPRDPSGAPSVRRPVAAGRGGAGDLDVRAADRRVHRAGAGDRVLAHDPGLRGHVGGGCAPASCGGSLVVARPGAAHRPGRGVPRGALRHVGAEPAVHDRGVLHRARGHAAGVGGADRASAWGADRPCRVDRDRHLAGGRARAHGRRLRADPACADRGWPRPGRGGARRALRDRGRAGALDHVQSGVHDALLRRGRGVPSRPRGRCCAFRSWASRRATGC